MSLKCCMKTLLGALLKEAFGIICHVQNLQCKSLSPMLAVCWMFPQRQGRCRKCCVYLFILEIHHGNSHDYFRGSRLLSMNILIHFVYNINYYAVARESLSHLELL